jgi:hypothetical protein
MQECEILPCPVVSKVRVIAGMFTGVEGCMYNGANPEL